MQLAPLSHALEPCRGHGGEVGVGIALQEVAQGTVECVFIFFGHVGQGVEKHKLGHDFAQRIFFLHTCVGGMYVGVAVVEICLVCSLIEFLLHAVHVAQLVDIVGVGHGYAVFRVGEVAQYELAPFLSLGGVALAKVHEVEVVVSVEAVYIVGVVGEQAVKLAARRTEVLKLVFEYHAHVVEAFLYHFMRCSPLFLGLRNLGEVIFGEVRVGGAGLCSGVYGLLVAVGGVGG